MVGNIDDLLDVDVACGNAQGVKHAALDNMCIEADIEHNEIVSVHDDKVNINKADDNEVDTVV